MDKCICFIPFGESVTYSPDYGHGDTLPIDQAPAQSFNIDPATGRPMSDLHAILKAQPLDRERLLANLDEFRADYLPEDVSDVDALKYQNPRLCQMPSELAEYAEFVTQKRLEEAKAKKEAEDFEEYKKSLSEKKEDAKKEVDDSKN